jgi:hypothetical protein
MNTTLFSNLAFFVCLILFRETFIQLETYDENGVHQQRSSHPTTATISSPMSSSVVLPLFVVATNANDVQAMLALRTAFNNYTNWMSSNDPCSGKFFFSSAFFYSINFSIVPAIHAPFNSFASRFRY